MSILCVVTAVRDQQSLSLSLSLPSVKLLPLFGRIFPTCLCFALFFKVYFSRLKSRFEHLCLNFQHLTFFFVCLYSGHFISSGRFFTVFLHSQLFRLCSLEIVVVYGPSIPFILGSAFQLKHVFTVSQKKRRRERKTTLNYP